MRILFIVLVFCSFASSVYAVPDKFKVDQEKLFLTRKDEVDNARHKAAAVKFMKPYNDAMKSVKIERYNGPHHALQPWRGVGKPHPVRDIVPNRRSSYEMSSIGRPR